LAPSGIDRSDQVHNPRGRGMVAQEDHRTLLVAAAEEAAVAERRKRAESCKRCLLYGSLSVAVCVLTGLVACNFTKLQPNSALNGPMEVPHPMLGDHKPGQWLNLGEMPHCDKTCNRICPALKKALQQYRVRSAHEVPAHFGLDLGFYKKYVNVMGIPVLSSDKLCDCVLQKAAWIVHGTVSHLVRMPEVLSMMVTNKHRVAIMARSEQTTDVPEHRTLKPKDYWDERARGLGGVPSKPCSSGAEESVMCESWATNSYFGENILLHEFTHGIARLGFKFLRWDGKDWDDYNGAVYRASKAKGLWRNTYASTNQIEFFAEAVQTWFDTNLKLPSCRHNPHHTDGVHNCINYRHELKTYDPGLYNHVARVFKEDRWRPGQGKSCGCAAADVITEGFVLLDANGNVKVNGGSGNGASSEPLRGLLPGSGPVGTLPSSPDGTAEVPVPSEKCFEMKQLVKCKELPGCGWDYHKQRCSHDCTSVRSASACWPTGECAWDGSSQRCHKCLMHVDKYNRCKVWAQRGGCEKRPRWMKDHCSSSCGGANNGHTHCESWARSGECAKNPGYMLQHCQQSCGCKQLMAR